MSSFRNNKGTEVWIRTNSEFKSINWVLANNCIVFTALR